MKERKNEEIQKNDDKSSIKKIREWVKNNIDLFFIIYFIYTVITFPYIIYLIKNIPEDNNIKESVVFETTVPETTVPETTVPETTVPETTVPETTVPETTVPETTIPETTIPETTIPNFLSDTNFETVPVNENLPEIPDFTEDEIESLAIVIYQEAGSDSISDLTRYRVGDVVLNRVLSPHFPNSINEVLLRPRQYGRFHWTGIKWPDKASNPGEHHAVERAKKIAKNILINNIHSDLYGNGWIWQAGFVQGSQQIWSDGICFGK